MAKKNQIDIYGGISSFLCAIHCMAFPVLISFGLISGAVLEAHDIVEGIVLAITLFLASWSIYRAHKNGQSQPVLIIMVAGLIILSISFITHGSHIWMAIGGLMVATGHILNFKSLVTA